VHLRVAGADGFELRGINTMASISRDPSDLVAQTLAAHQYPDGFMLFLGTLFAPIEDRDQPGGGFTHHLGDLVSIQSAWLGGLHNRVAHSEAAAPWRFGLRAFMANLAQRGLLHGTAL
jgi:fumarylacetoacetate (FAA) hydrolase family protein